MKQTNGKGIKLKNWLKHKCTEYSLKIKVLLWFWMYIYTEWNKCFEDWGSLRAFEKRKRCHQVLCVSIAIIFSNCFSPKCLCQNYHPIKTSGGPESSLKILEYSYLLCHRHRPSSWRAIIIMETNLSRVSPVTESPGPGQWPVFT